MPLELLPMEESDMLDYMNLFAEAFKDELMAIIYPNGYFDEDKQVGIDFQLKEWRNHPDIVKYMKVIDTDLPEDAPLGRIVGVSKWKFYPRDRTQEELDEAAREFKDRTLPPNANKAFMEEFFGALSRCKEEVLGGKAHALLSVLATLPTHHRRGIGAIHIKWGLDQADKVSLLCSICKPGRTQSLRK